MNRFEENTVIVGQGINLTEEEILRLEIELIELGRLSETDRLEYNDKGQLVVIYEQHIEFMDQQTQQSSNSIPVPDYSPPPLYGSTQRSLAGQPSRSMYNEYGNEKEDIKHKGRRMPLETIDKKLLLDDRRLLNLMAHDPQKWTTVIEVWSQMVARKYDELEIEKTPVEMYSYLEKFLGETARAA